MIKLAPKPKPIGSLAMQKMSQMKFGLEKKKAQIEKERNQLYIFDYKQFKDNK